MSEDHCKHCEHYEHLHRDDMVITPCWGCADHPYMKSHFKDNRKEYIKLFLNDAYIDCEPKGQMFKCASCRLAGSCQIVIPDDIEKCPFYNEVKNNGKK